MFILQVIEKRKKLHLDNWGLSLGHTAASQRLARCLYLGQTQKSERRVELFFPANEQNRQYFESVIS